MVGYRNKIPNRKLDLRMHARLRMTKNKFYSITNDITNFYEHMLDFKKGYAEDLDIILMRFFLDTSMSDVYKTICATILLRRFYLYLSRSRLLVWVACTQVFKKEEFKFTTIRSRWVPITIAYITFTNSYLPLSANMGTLHIIFYYVVVALLIYLFILMLPKLQNNCIEKFFYKTPRRRLVELFFFIKMLVMFAILH